MMHNLGVIQYAFAFGVWAPFTEKLNEVLRLEALDSMGKVSLADVRCSNTDVERPNDISLRCEGGEPLAALPTDPPISVQLEEVQIVGGAVRATGWIAARSRVAKVVVTVDGKSAPAVVGEQIAKDGLGDELLPNAVEDFTAEIQIAVGQPVTQVAVVAVSDEGAEYHGEFSIDGIDDALTAIDNLTQDRDYADNNSSPPAVIYVEYPTIEDGVATFKNRQQFKLAGWAVGRQEIERLNVYVEGKFVGKAVYGTPRPDVAQAFPQWAHAARSGFNIPIDTQSLLGSPTIFVLEAHLSDGREVRRTFELRFGDTDATDQLLDMLLTDEGIWRFARTLKMFAAGKEDEILTGLQEQALRRNDSAENVRIRRIRTALQMLGDAWMGRPIEQKVARFLSDRGFL